MFEGALEQFMKAYSLKVLWRPGAVLLIPKGFPRYRASTHVRQLTRLVKFVTCERGLP